MHSRYDENRGKAYTDSYRVIRMVVGFLGILLPFLFMIGEAFLRGSVHVRGSLSAYYHTSMQDVFVGGLCVIGVLLGSYMAGERKTLDFWASLIAGVAVLGVVFFPTSRSGLPTGAPACGSVPQTPPGCSFVEQALGENTTAVIHPVFAVVFILSLAIMSFLFAISEKLPLGPLAVPDQPGPRQGRFLFHSACAIVILAAGAWVFVGKALGVNIWELTPLYVGEVASVWAFGFSWLVAGFYLTAPFKTTTTQVTTPGTPPTADAAVSGGPCQPQPGQDNPPEEIVPGLQPTANRWFTLEAHQYGIK